MLQSLQEMITVHPKNVEKLSYGKYSQWWSSIPSTRMSCAGRHLIVPDVLIFRQLPATACLSVFGLRFVDLTAIQKVAFNFTGGYAGWHQCTKKKKHMMVSCPMLQNPFEVILGRYKWCKQ